MMPSSILDTEPMSKKDCEIKAARYLEKTIKTFNDNAVVSDVQGEQPSQEIKVTTSTK